MSSSVPAGSTNPSRGQEPPPESRTQSGLRRLHSTLPWSQRATRLLGDWMGITILFFLWIAMLILVAHNVIIPRTCAQSWPLWVPLLGGMKSMLAATAP